MIHLLMEEEIPRDLWDVTGFDHLMREEENPFKPKPAIVPRCIRGQVWGLGNHRLACGDATNEQEVALLMAGQQGDIIFTDPPYNVDYGASKNPRHKIRKIKGDNMSAQEWIAFTQAWLAIIKKFYKGGDFYCWGASGPDGMRQRLVFVESGVHWSATIIWKKDQLILTPANYQRIYECCFYGWLKKSTYHGGRNQVEVWEIDRPTDPKDHPTMKPIELCGRAIRNSSSPGDIVLDFFGGSGSTLVACEQSNRRCFMIEIDPYYCEVTMLRWEKLTGRKAELIEDAN
jgi:DNA modification methylase